MNEKLLHDFKLNEQMNIPVLLKEVVNRTAKNGKAYLAIIFEDKSGEMDGMYWGVTPTEIQTFVPGTVVQLHATRQMYRGKPQLKVANIKAVTAESKLQPSDFIATAPIRRQRMETEINQVLFSITNPEWNRIVRYLLQKHHDQFYSYPAAKKNHHSYTGGLAYHTLSIVRLAQGIVPLYPQINQGLLLAGALLHDIGKTIELSGPVSTSYTVAGNLLGHIAIADAEIVLAVKDLQLDENSESILALRHVVLAHHGLLEYGSPVRPALLEAEVLHQLDELDASIEMFTHTVEQTEPGKFSDRVYALDKRMIYHPKNLE
ncbi:3'-5' exoribonuclease YhaM family protein [Periweissella ghanensis]|uniref:3'-5' exoribonuclease YhaM n=1 Tax=Periweissella ghanensis TaxID=467997 RepID=A0ABM8ZAS2_9LACO|nr:HD domain-containing protein [Periweissella ghanensis]MCM0600752.1 HD domain-containing protein [Periweissella ghanensis]CAH0418606.1 3'-5' exoribonuclease YhaM [Periweissella ghanensis]